MTKFYLDPSEFNIKKLSSIHAEWQNIPDQQIRNYIVAESQYLDFHTYILNALRYEWLSEDRKTCVRGIINYAVRAGIVKAAILAYASIIEAALRAHADRRGYPLPEEEYRRTYGKVLNAWEKGGKSECAEIWNELCTVGDYRKLIHLYVAEDENKDWNKLLNVEDELLKSAEKVVSFLKKLKST